MTQSVAIDMAIDCLDRSNHLLDAVKRFVTDNPVSDYTVVYDEVECDGECLGNDSESAIDQSTFALAALRALPPDEWMPIESAPKDRKYKLAWSPDRHMSFQVSWRELLNSWCLIGSDETHWDDLTHWRPLPAPPKEQS